MMIHSLRTVKLWNTLTKRIMVKCNEEKKILGKSYNELRIRILKAFELKELEIKDADIDELDPFYNALKSNKISLMNDLNIRPKDYDMIAKTLIGITMEETEGGSGGWHNFAT